jgi:pimeloyl-ACP methyl ester carboxylesterase
MARSRAILPPAPRPASRLAIQPVADEAMAQPPPAQSDTPFASVWPLAAWPQVPTRVLVGRDDRLFPADFQRRVAEERLGITPDEIPGGHLLALSQPQALVEQFDAYTASLHS